MTAHSGAGTILGQGGGGKTKGAKVCEIRFFAAQGLLTDPKISVL